MSTLRPLRPEDQPPVRAWLDDWLQTHISGWTRAYALEWSDVQVRDHIEQHALVAREWEAIAESAASDHAWVRIAERAGEPIGIVWVEERQERYLSVPIGVLSWVYVAPHARRRGEGGQLLSAAREWMKSRGLKTAEVFVTADNTPAVRAYEEAGFQPLDVRLVADLGGSDLAHPNAARPRRA